MSALRRDKGGIPATTLFHNAALCGVVDVDDAEAFARSADINTAAAITPDSAPRPVTNVATSSPGPLPAPGGTWLPAKRRGRMRALVELPKGPHR